MTVDDGRLRRACSMVLRAAALSADRGLTRDYFAREFGWEAEMRHRFAKARRDLDAGVNSARENATELFRLLNRRYNTRFDLDHHEAACNAILDFLPQNIRTLELFVASPEHTVEIASTVTRALPAIRAFAPRQPYSLTTKYLHFLFPEVFVIYDSRAADSVWMWSLFAIGDDQPEQRPFLATRLSETSGGGYAGLLHFYQCLWQQSGEEDRHRARLAADSLNALLRSQPGNELASVTVIDLVDKHLWTGGGNPLRLGLAPAP